MTAVSFKDSGMLLSDWIKLNQSAKKRIDVSRIDISSRSGYTSNNSNSNSPYLTHRSTEQIASNSQTKTYKMRIGSSNSENSSVQSAQSLPSVYVKKMRLDAFDTNAHLKPDNNIHGKIYQKNNNGLKAVAPLAAQHWYKLTKKSNVIKVQAQSSDANILETQTSKQVEITKEVNDTSVVVENETQKQINETKNFNKDTVDDKIIENHHKATEASSNLIATAAIVPLTETKQKKKKRNSSLKRESISRKEVIKENTDVNKIENVSESVVAVIAAEKSEKKVTVQPEPVKKTEDKPKKSKGNKIADSTAQKNSEKEPREDQFAKVIRDLDQILEKDLNNLASNDDVLLPEPEHNQLLGKILSKEFQKNVDNFLRSNEYQESFYENCKNLTQ